MNHTVSAGRTLKVTATPSISHILNAFPNAITLGDPSANALSPHTNAFIPNDLPFTVIVRGKPFKLTYNQIIYDQPNIFTTAFLGGFAESESRTMTIADRSPALFQVIYEYLAGYAILPDPSIDLRNLLSDCEYYGLQRLKDELTLPKLVDALSSKHILSRVVRLEDVCLRRVPEIEWNNHGLVESTQENQTTSLPRHLMVYLTKTMFKLDLVVKSNGECSQALFSIELPAYAANLRSKPLSFRDDDDQDWAAVMAESLSSTPLTLNDGEFEGNFGDLVQWINTFLYKFSSGCSGASASSSRPIIPLQDPEVTEKLSKIMPSLAENLRSRALQGPTLLKLATSFWASDMSIVVAPLNPVNSSNSTSNLVAKILNCNLSTGLYRRKCARPFVNI